jgi:HEAT repeat protein
MVFRALAAALALAVCVGQACAEEAKIKGKPLSVWIKQLTGPNRGLQLRASRALAGAPEEARPKVTEKLIPILGSDRENDRFVAAQVLGEYGAAAKAAVPGLLPMLKGTQFERNRAAAAKALGQILKDAKPSEQIAEVTRALTAKFAQERDGYTDVRREAARALGMIGSAAKGCIPKLTKALRDGDLGVRRQGAWACGRMGPAAAEHIDLLISVMHAEAHLNNEAIWAIGEIGTVHENVVPNLVDKIEAGVKGWGGPPIDRMRAKGFRALEKFGPRSALAVDLIARWLKERRFRGDVVIQMLKTLEAIGPKARPALEVVKEHAASGRTAAARKAATECAAALESGGKKSGDGKPVDGG